MYKETCNVCTNCEEVDGKCINFSKYIDGKNMEACENFEIGISLLMPQNHFEEILRNTDDFEGNLQDVLAVALNTIFEQHAYRAVLDMENLKIKLVNHYTNDMIIETNLKLITFLSEGRVQLKASMTDYMQLKHFFLKYISESIVFFEIEDHLHEKYIIEKVSNTGKLLRDHSIELTFKSVESEYFDNK